MTTRGERIKRERNRRRMSQMDLHKATDVGLRTIGRIEAGENENSSAVDALEAYFGLTDGSVTTDRSPDMEPGAPPGGLESFTLMELLAEAVRRVAQAEARTGERFVGDLPPQRVKWSTADAPSRRRSNPEGPGERGVR